MTIHTFVFNAFQENTYVLFDETREAAVIDPGCYEPSEKAELEQFIVHQQLQVKYLLNTHCHIDHVLGNDFVKERFKVKLLIHPIEENVLRAVKTYAPNYGFNQYHEALPDGYLEEGETIKFGKSTLEVLFVPGHAPGHIAFVDRAGKMVIGGDVLFAGSVGRTDLPGGDMDTLIQSIQQKLFTLPDDFEVFPGHGPSTTIGEEKVSNPYCALSLIK